jgi:cytochrome P450
MPMLPINVKSAKSIDFQRKSVEMLEHRKRMGKSRADVFTHLLAEDTETGTSFSDLELAANSRLMIVAGSGNIRPPTFMQCIWLNICT